MPDGMTTPENSYDKFKIGEASQLIGMGDPIIPESVLAITNPINLLEDDKERQRQLDEFIRNLQMGGRGATNITAEFGEALLEVDKSPEKVSVLYTEMISESMGAIFDLYEKNVKSDEKNAYPYDYRTAEYMQQNIKQATTSLERRSEIKNSKEAQVYISELKQDLIWLDSFLHTTVAQTASLPYKFDVIMWMQLLKEGRYCAFVTNDDMEALMSEGVPGTQLSQEQVTLKQAKKIGIAVPEEYTKNLDSQGESLEGKPLVEGPTNLREMAVKMYASSFKLRMGLAAASQADFADANPETTTFKEQNFSKEELVFYKDLFWDKDEGQFLTPYVTSKGDYTREYTTLLEAALIKNAHFRIKDIIALPNTLLEKTEMISNLTKEIKAEALTRRSNWRTRQEKDVVSMLATLIIQQGLLQDFAYGHSYRYCYEYQWDTDPVTGNPTVKKGVEMGGIYSLSGDFSSLGWARRKHVYDGMSNSCTKFLLPTSSNGRKETSMLSPFEMIHFDPTLSNDEFLNEQWKFLFSNESKYVEERKSLGYKSLHPDVAEQLQRWAFKWETPYSDKFLLDLEDRDGSTGENIVIPHLMPPALGNIANFWESISLDPKIKLNKGAKSVFQELIEGKETYEIDWGRCETQAHSRWKVDMDMSSRYMNVLISAVDETKDPILGLFREGPGTFPAKELAKRIRLSMRDGSNFTSTDYEVALIPFFAVMACAEKYGIGGAYGWQQTTKEDQESGTTNADRFFTEMAYWKRALKWLPGDRPEKDKFDQRMNYGNTMALLAEFYEAIISRMHKASSEESFALAKQNLVKTTDRLNKFEHLNKGTFKFKIVKKKALFK